MCETSSFQWDQLWTCRDGQRMRVQAITDMKKLYKTRIQSCSDGVWGFSSNHYKKLRYRQDGFNPVEGVVIFSRTPLAVYVILLELDNSWLFSFDTMMVCSWITRQHRVTNQNDWALVMKRELTASPCLVFKFSVILYLHLVCMRWVSQILISIQ